MIRENLSFLKQMVQEKRDLYSIFSFLSESIDVLRTPMLNQSHPAPEVYIQIEEIIENLEILDELLGKSDFNA